MATTNARDGESSDAERPDGIGRRPELGLAVVEYENGPDRATVYAPGSTGVDRMERWLSADLSAFVSLEERR